MTRRKLEDLLEGRLGALEAAAVEAGDALVEDLFHLPLALRLELARFLDAARRLLVVDIDQEDP